MNTKLILTFSGDGRFQACLAGQGRKRAKILNAFTKHIEKKLPIIKRNIRDALGVNHENTNSNLN